MLNSIFRFLLICFISANISSAQGIEEYFDLPGLTKSGDDWEVTSIKINSTDGHIKLHQDKWLMYFLHWRSLTQEKKNLSIEYVQDLMLNFWGQAIHFELTDIDGEIEVYGHKGFFTEGNFGKGAIYTRFIVWNCPQTNRQFVADCNINLRRGTPKELLEVQKLITQTVCCHKGRTPKTIPGLSKKYKSSEWNLSFDIPENWNVADFPDKEWFPKGMTKENGSLWTLLTDSEKHIELFWEETGEDISPSLFDKFLRKIITYSVSSEDSSEITDMQLISLQEKNGYYLGKGVYKLKTVYRGSERKYDYGFRGLLWKEKKRVYFLIASLIQLKEFWGIQNDLTPTDKTFQNFLWEEVVPNIKPCHLKAGRGDPEIYGKGENLESAEIDDYRFDDIFEIIRNRRTVREFQKTPIPEEHVIKILDAARYAPTAGNVQPWKFVVIQNITRLDSLKSLLQASWEQRIKEVPDLSEEKKKSYLESGREAIQSIMTAPVYIMIFVDTMVYPKYALYDGCLAVENLMLAARAFGYGTGFFTTYFPEELVKSFVDAPENLKFICATPIGIPKEWPKMPPKKELDDLIIQEVFENN